MSVENNLGALDERVKHIETQYVHLRETLSSISAKVDDRFNSIQVLVTQKSQTNWSVLGTFAGLIVVIIGALGTLAFRPVDAALSSHASAIEKIREAIVPRGEHVELWRGNQREIENLQKQLDHLRADHQSVYGSRDVIFDLKERIRSMEMAFAKK